MKFNCNDFISCNHLIVCYVIGICIILSMVKFIFRKQYGIIRLACIIVKTIKLFYSYLTGCFLCLQIFQVSQLSIQATVGDTSKGFGFLFLTITKKQ